MRQMLINALGMYVKTPAMMNYIFNTFPRDHAF